MNKSDCVNIGWTLSRFVAGEIDSDDIISEISSLDSRIREQFELFGDCRQRDQDMSDRYDYLMTKELGNNWSLSKRCKEISKRVWKQAEDDIPDY